MIRLLSTSMLCSTLLAGNALAEDHFIQHGGTEFNPPVLNVAPGDVVRWGIGFPGGSPRTITSGEDCIPDGLWFDGEIPPGLFTWEVPLDIGVTEVPYFNRLACKNGEPGLLRIIDIRQVPSEYPTIQEALDAADPYDTIEIAPGTYFETDLTFGADNIFVRGEVDADGLPTVIIGPKPGTTSSPSIMSIDGVDGIRIEGIQFTGSRATTGGGVNIVSGSVVVENCLFTDNMALTGGGLSFSGSELSLVDCTFRDNAANVGAGASFSNGTVSVVDCVFEGNDAEAGKGGPGSGGGFWTGSNDVFLSDSLIQDNEAEGGGGGITASSSSLEISGSVISENEAIIGGGIYLSQSSAAIGDSRVCGNSPEQIVGSWTNEGNSLVREECGILFVPDDFSTIQAAVDAAYDEDVIVVAPGTYSGDAGEPTVRVNGKRLTITGASNPQNPPQVMIDGGGVAEAFRADESSDGDECALVLQNLHFISGGLSLRSGTHVVTNCIVEDAPGGAFFMNSQVTVTDCIFRGNYSSQFAGVILFANPVETHVTMVDCLIEENTAGTPGAPGGIAGIYVAMAKLTLDGCTVQNNASNVPGLSGVWNESSIPAEVLDTTICGNTEGDVPGDQIQGPWSDLGGNSVLPVCASDCPGDFNNDGSVDGGDLGYLLAAWGGPDADINGDGNTDGGDLGLFLSVWGDC